MITIYTVLDTANNYQSWGWFYTAYDAQAHAEKVREQQGSAVRMLVAPMEVERLQVLVVLLGSHVGEQFHKEAPGRRSMRLTVGRLEYHEEPTRQTIRGRVKYRGKYYPVEKPDYYAPFITQGGPEDENPAPEAPSTPDL